MTTRYLTIALVTLAAVFAVYAASYALTTPAPQMGQSQPMRPGMAGQAMGNPTPPVKGLYKGKQITFIHTEASDPQVADMLTRMMGPKVLTVPGLARIPGDLLANVYVFTNGIKGDGPLGFQMDVFDSVPGDARYTPLRAVTLVTWKQSVAARLLGSVENIQTTARKGDVSLRRPGAVVNMPIIRWPGGGR